MARRDSEAREYWRRKTFDMPTPPERELPEAEVRRVRVNRQGYTSSGYYYGVGAPVFEYTVCLPTGRCSDSAVRADNMAHAKDRIRGMVPGVRFPKGGIR